MPIELHTANEINVGCENLRTNVDSKFISGICREFSNVQYCRRYAKIEYAKFYYQI